MPSVSPPIPPLLAGAPPLAILVDYDGTIALTDVSDSIMAENVAVSLDVWESWNADWEAGIAGSRQLMERELALLDADPSTLVQIAERQPHDTTFPSFVETALELGVVVEIVSDGFGFFIEPALARLGVPSIPIVTAVTTFEGTTATIAFPNGHAECFVCGTCKRNRVLAHRALGRSVVFVGDGESDRYAAAHSDLVFAKRALVGICARNAWPFRRWTEFAEIERWLTRTVDGWRADPAAIPSPGPKAPYCGPEVWGPGRVNPPPGVRQVQSPVD